MEVLDQRVQFLLAAVVVEQLMLVQLRELVVLVVVELVVIIQMEQQEQPTLEVAVVELEEIIMLMAEPVVQED
tara:strand:- start:487 stop:705 length:219 start_codon:yes stop_codon:yes gene_type:complete